jgi:glutathione S-transferase
MPVLDQRLSKPLYLAGDAVTIADFAVHNGFDLTEINAVVLSAALRFNEWREALRAQELYQSAHTHFGAGILPSFPCRDSGDY